MSVLTILLKLFRPGFDSPFGQWFYAKIRRVAFVVSVPALYSLWLAIKHLVPNEECFDKIIPSSVNMAFCLLAAMLFNDRRLKLTLSGNEPKVEAAVQLFTKYWSYVWLFWFFGYFFNTANIFFVQTLNLLPQVPSGVFDFVFDLFCYAVSFCFLISYFILLRPEDKNPIPWNAIWITGLLVFLALIVNDFNPFNYPPRQEMILNMIIGFGFGTYNCVLLALLAGRFESRFFHAPIWVVLLFYIYAGLQVGYETCGAVAQYDRSLPSGPKESTVFLINTNQLNLWNLSTNKDTITASFSDENDLIGIWQDYPKTNTAKITLTKMQQDDLTQAQTNKQYPLPENLSSDIRFDDFKLNSSFNCWLGEQKEFDYFQRATLLAFCFLKALLFVFVLWLVDEGSLVAYFRAAINKASGPLEVHLQARDATLIGKLKYECSTVSSVICYWHSNEDCVVWEFFVPRPARFTVVAEQSCGRGCGGRYEVVVKGVDRLACSVQVTDAWSHFMRNKLGEIDIPKPGNYSLTIKPDKIDGGSLMNLRSITFRSEK